MVDATRALLDELMGKDRNSLQKGGRSTHFSDPEVCKNFLCGFCPYELFTNTKSDLGHCNKLHDEKLKQDYNSALSSNKAKYPFERDFIRFLERLIDDLDRKIKKAMERVELQDGPPSLPVESEKAKEITERIQSLLQQVEDLAEEGKIDQSQQVMKAIDVLKLEKDKLVGNTTEQSAYTLSGEKKMKVCEICGAFLVVGDTEKRMSSHMDGKQHIGYALIRKTLDDNKRIRKEEGERDPESNRGRDYRDNRDGRGDNRDYRRSSGGFRNDDRGRNYRDNDRRRRERSRSRSKERENRDNRRRERDQVGPGGPVGQDDEFDRDKKRHR